jgi:hypothetical protein
LPNPIVAQPISSQTQTPHETPAGNAVNFNLNRGNHLENLRKQLLEKQQAAQDNNQPILQKNEPEQLTTFTIEEFANVWNNYIVHLEKNAKSRISSFLKNTKYRINQFKIELELKSNLEQDLLDEEKLDMIPFFRSQLKNNKIEFSFTINTDLIQQTKKISKTDILKNMTDKQPLISELVQTLGLEIEY